MIVLYDQDISSHFPPHYKTVYENIVCERGGRIFCYSASTLDGELPPFYDCIINSRNVITARLRIARRFIAHAFRNRKRLAGETILAHDDVVLALSAFVVARLWSGKFVYRISQIKPEVRALKSGPVMRIVMRLAASIRNIIMLRADAVVLMSEEMRSYFERQGVRARLTEVVPSCVDTSLYGSTRLVDEQYEAFRQKLQSFERVLIYVGNINLARGVGVLAPTVAVLNNRRPTAMLFVGARAQVSECSRLERAFAQEGIGSSFFATDKIPEEHLEPYVRLGQVGLSIFDADTIYRVNSPLKILNYLASGIPFVGTKTLDQQTLARETGFGVIAEMTVESIVDAVETALSLPMTRDSTKAAGWVKQHRDLSVAESLLLPVVSRLNGEDRAERVVDVSGTLD